MSGRPIVHPHLRISDAERAEVTEALKRHCTDGRLDSAEFEARLDRALRAKTRGDLAGLFDDLPDLTPGSPSAEPPAGRFARGGPSTGVSGLFGSWGNFAAGTVSPRRRSSVWSLAMVVLVVVAGVAILSAIAHMFVHLSWLILVVLAALIWRRGHHHHHHHHRFGDRGGAVDQVDRRYPW